MPRSELYSWGPVYASFLINSVSVLSQPTQFQLAFYFRSQSGYGIGAGAAHAWDTFPNEGLAGAQGIAEEQAACAWKSALVLGQEKEFW